jgi:hypothetical protein
MNNKQTDYKDNQNQTVFSEPGFWLLRYRPNKVSQPWSTLGVFDNKLNAIIKANQVSSKYFMVKVTDLDGSIAWSD